MTTAWPLISSWGLRRNYTVTGSWRLGGVWPDGDPVSQSQRVNRAGGEGFVGCRGFVVAGQWRLGPPQSVLPDASCRGRAGSGFCSGRTTLPSAASRGAPGTGSRTVPVVGQEVSGCWTGTEFPQGNRVGSRMDGMAAALPWHRCASCSGTAPWKQQAGAWHEEYWKGLRHRHPHRCGAHGPGRYCD